MNRSFLIGLGNPGEQYVHTRHNVGFQLTDAYVQAYGGQWSFQSSWNAKIAQSEQTVVIQPQTFMNESGMAAQAAVQYFLGAHQLQEETNSTTGLNQVWVVYDDLDLAVGEWKIQFAKHPKVHNGVNSVLEHFGTNAFWHVRIGADGRKGDRRVPPDAYVLSKWTAEERMLLAPVFQSVLQEMHAAFVSP